MTQVYDDPDMIELDIEVSNGDSLFSTMVYVCYSELDKDIAGFSVFRECVRGGLFNIQWGEFGPEYGSGAFHTRFHFGDRGLLYLTCKLQTDYMERPVTRTRVADEATFHLKTEPILLDQFVAQLKGLRSQTRKDAFLEAIK